VLLACFFLSCSSSTLRGTTTSNRSLMYNLNKRSWNVLNWNIRGLNDIGKSDAMRAKIEESSCAIYCLQETKKENFNHSFIKKLAPKRFDKFAFSPSVGASGGILVGWNSALFHGEVIHNLIFALTIKFTSKHDNRCWWLTNVYGPCQGPEREGFVKWLNELEIPDDANLMILGDFNFCRPK
jgi:exonuclease III